MRKSCKEDEILNPKTNRCVKRVGKIGRDLVAKMASPTTTQYQVYIPAYLRQEQPIKTLKEYIEIVNPPAATTTTLKFLQRFLKTLVREIMDITLMCSEHYRNTKNIKRNDVIHTLKLLDVIDDEKDIPRKEDKEFTTIITNLVKKSVDDDVKLEPNVYPVLSRVLGPMTVMTPSTSFMDNFKSIKPSNKVEKLSLRYV